MVSLTINIPPGLLSAACCFLNEWTDNLLVGICFLFDILDLNILNIN